jgi:mannose-6-phosphate isomerase
MAARPEGDCWARPIRLPANPLERFYRGGAAIAQFRGVAPAGDNLPEDWIGSTTPALGAAPNGLTMLPDGRLLCDAVASEPERFLGPEHVAAIGPEPALLVKLLDAGERLPVHLHPDRAFALTRLGSRFGKSEAWLVLDGGTIHLGFRHDISAKTLRGWFESQDAAAMLAASNDVHVGRGDCVYVPAGTPHAIGAGVFMVEVQEPSDLGVLLEWRPFVSREEATMGLDVEIALAATRRSGVSRAELASWTRRSSDAPELRPGARAVVPPEAWPFFRAEWLRPEPAVELEPSFAVLVAVSGSGRLTTEGGALGLARGDTVLVPYGAGAGRLAGDIEAIRCLPPSGAS